MNTERPVTIGAAGLRANELCVLKSVCLLSNQQARLRRFEMAHTGMDADFVVLDPAADKASLADLIARATKGVLWIGDEALVSRAIVKQVLQRPLLASRLLGALDKLAQALVSPAEAASTDDAGPTATVAAPKAFKPSVLVVDDSPTVRKQIELVLAGMEAHVVSVETGEAALDLLQRQNFDLVLLDVVLPGADGYSVCRSIKRAQQTCKLPVVMLTSKSSPFDKIRGTLAGCDDYLTKPATSRDFKRTVMRYLEPALSAGLQPLASPQLALAV